MFSRFELSDWLGGLIRPSRAETSQWRPLPWGLLLTGVSVLVAVLVVVSLVR